MGVDLVPCRPKHAPVIIYYSNKVTTTILGVWFVSMSEVKYAVAV